MDYNLLVAAKTEYTETLQDILGDGIYNGIKEIFQDCKKDKTSVLKNFQRKLCEIPSWNQEVINSICKKTMEKNDITMEYLDKVIEAVFLSNIKILSVVKINDAKSSINVSVPDTKNFIHRCYIEAARRFYSDPYLIDDRETGSNTQQEMKRNVKRSYGAIQDSVEKTIRGMIPMEDILTKYLNSQPEHESNSDQDFDEPQTPTFQENIIQEPQREPSPIEEEHVQSVEEQETTVEDLFQKEPEQEINQEINQKNEEEKKVIDLKQQETHFFTDSD